jgi:polyribonucleotide nucleotidyltransferase
MAIKKEIEWGGRTLSVETGLVAKQAHGSAWIQYGDTVVLAAMVSAEDQDPTRNFLPLMIDYREKQSAGGRIPGGFFKREGRPTEREILTARLTDRPLRSLFPKGYRVDTQVQVQVLSADGENEPDVLGVLAASASMHFSVVPWAGPVAAVRIGRVEGELIVNPTTTELKASDMDIIVVGSEESIVMVEGKCDGISEDDMVAALELAHTNVQPLIQLQNEIAQELGITKREYVPEEVDADVEAEVRKLAEEKLSELLKNTDRQTRNTSVKELRSEIIEQLAEAYPESESDIKSVFGDMSKAMVRDRVVIENIRLDGRGPEDIRDIECRVSVLPRTHGSAIFTRGQTQALGTVTLGTKKDEQRIEGYEGEDWRKFMLHYNFPCFSVGEIRPIRGPGRREIGHGNLAERALVPTLPPHEDFPYTIRIVSDVLESNGSSSMATVCAGTLAMMDAGVPIENPAAGIAMGLIKEGDKMAVLTDILGDEDHLGDMDFKVCGTRKGITSFQMDIKIAGVSRDIMAQALNQARDARLRILDIMEEAIPQSRGEISKHAPKIIRFMINPKDIGTVIGPGGKMIRKIQEATECTIDIDDDGSIFLGAPNPELGAQAKEMIDLLLAKPENGKVYTGTVKRLAAFGAFVEILPGKDGLLHISEIDTKRIEKVEDVLKMGDTLDVKVIRIDQDGKVRLSRKVLLQEEERSAE